MVLLGTIAWWLARALAALSFPLPLHGVVAGAFIAIGIALNVLPKALFRRADTTVNPIRPAATKLVTSGIYRYSRNPMYLGHAVILLGWALHLHNMASVLVVPAFVAWITRFQIQPEERHLAARFAGEYAAFYRRSPRWL